MSFAYQAQPGQHGSRLRTSNIHLLLEFFLGVYDWLHIPIPIWIIVESLIGTVRLRIQFIPEPPYVRNLTFTLLGVPGVEVSAVPLVKALPNVLDLPLVSTFVRMAIKAGTVSLVAPNSITLNLQEILSGPGAASDTRALGVFLITIHHCTDLSAQDSNGFSDPYIVAAYAKFGKPLYSTRIILRDLNPVYEETFAMLVTEDEVRAGEELSLMLWDSDKRSADDLIGRVQVPVSELMASPNRWVDRTDHLVGYEDKDAMSGTVSWSVGYFSKLELKEAMRSGGRKEVNVPVKEDLASEALEKKELARRPLDASAPLKDLAGQPGKNKAIKEAVKEFPVEPPSVFNTRPDPAFPSGILSLTVHQINDLERQNLNGASGGEREGERGQDTARADELSENLPSAYVEFVVNDEMVYKTRVKNYNSYPFFVSPLPSLPPHCTFWTVVHSLRAAGSIARALRPRLRHHRRPVRGPRLAPARERPDTGGSLPPPLLRVLLLLLRHAAVLHNGGGRVREGEVQLGVQEREVPVAEGAGGVGDGDAGDSGGRGEGGVWGRGGGGEVWGGEVERVYFGVEEAVEREGVEG